MAIITNIKDSVISRLKSLYPNCECFDEIINQGLIEPSFFVRIIEQNMKKEVGNRYKFTVMFDISYFLDINTGNLNEQCHTVAENLYENFETFPYLSSGYLKGLNKNHNIQDKVLHFMFDIVYYTKLDIDEIKVNNIDISSDIKE